MLIILSWLIYSVQFSSVAPSCPTLCDPMNCSTPGLLVQNQLPESTQTHVHRVGDAIQPSYFLMPSFPFAFNFPSIRVFSNELVLCIRCQSIGTLASALIFLHIQGWFPSGLTGLISLQSKGLSGVFSSPPSQKASVLQCSAFFMVQLSHPSMTTGKTIAMIIGILLAKWCLCLLPYCLGLS